VSARDPETPAPVTLIPAGYDGRLSAPGRERMPVRVFERGSDMLMLVVLLDADTGLPPEPIEPVLVEYSSVHGLVRLRGEAVMEQRDLIRFRPSDAAEVLQRREFVRIDAPQPVVLEHARDGDPIRTHAVDVSGGGMLLRGLEELEEGQSVRFSLELGAGMAPVQGVARVVRTEEGGHRGLVFDAISSAERQRLIHFIFDRQRAERAKTRDARRKHRSR